MRYFRPSWSTPGQGADGIRRYSAVLSGTAKVGVTSKYACQRVESHLLDAEEVRGSNPLAPTVCDVSRHRRHLSHDILAPLACPRPW
jgi:hypothetical protein